MGEPNCRLRWQSRAILLLVVPWTVLSALIQSVWWFREMPRVAWTTLGISAAFGLIVWRLRAGTPAAAATGAAITASLMFSTARFPYEWSWLHGGLMPLLAVFLLTWGATKIGRAKKERLGTAEAKRGRNAAQVAANLGVAAMMASPMALSGGDQRLNAGALLAIAALSEAAADTVSSEIGQVFGGEPRMLTTLRRVAPGTDGGVTIAGTLAGILTAAVVAATGTWALDSPWQAIAYSAAGATLGLFFDSLLGATCERKGWLNNDAVNFLSTAAAVAFSLGIAAPLLTHF